MNKYDVLISLEHLNHSETEGFKSPGNTGLVARFHLKCKRFLSHE